MYKDNNLSETASSHTLKPEKPDYIRNEAAVADDRRFASQRLSHPPNNAVQSSDNASTNPEHHWGRPAPILNTAAPHPQAKVANWLGSGVGGEHGRSTGGCGHGSASGSGGGNQAYGASKQGSVRNGNGDPGSGHQGTQNSVAGDWNKFGTAGAWGANAGQDTVPQTAGNAQRGNGDGEGQPEVEW